jgi:hypothetical protein
MEKNEWIGFTKDLRKRLNVLGVDFQKDYYESETYKLGKDIIERRFAEKCVLQSVQRWCSGR